MLTETEKMYLLSLKKALGHYEAAKTDDEKLYYLTNMKSITEALRSLAIMRQKEKK